MTAVPAAAAPLALPPALRLRRAALADYVRLWREVAGDGVLAIVAHGPALSGDERAPIDTAVVLADHRLDALRAVARRGARLQRAGLAAPLVLTAAEIDASRDSFPLELIDLQQCSHLLHGADPFAGLVFAPEHVRLQCERELQSLRLAARQRLLAAAGDEDQLAAHDLADRLVRVARGLLVLRGAQAPLGALATIAACAASCAVPLPAATAVWRGAAGWDAFAAFGDELGALWRMCDAL